MLLPLGSPNGLWTVNSILVWLEWFTFWKKSLFFEKCQFLKKGRFLIYVHKKLKKVTFKDSEWFFEKLDTLISSYRWLSSKKSILLESKANYDFECKRHFLFFLSFFAATALDLTYLEVCLMYPMYYFLQNISENPKCFLIFKKSFTLISKSRFF